MSEKIPLDYTRGWKLADSYISQRFDVFNEQKCPSKNVEFVKGYDARIQKEKDDKQKFISL